MQNPATLLSIEQVVRRKSYKNSIDKLNVDIKNLISHDFQKYTNLLYAPNSQRMPSPTSSAHYDPRPKTVYLKEETVKIRKRMSSKQRIMTQGKPTPEVSFSEVGRKGRQSVQVECRGDSRPGTGGGGKQGTKIELAKQNMMKTFNAFLFKIELPDKPKALSRKAKKRDKQTRDSQNLSPSKVGFDQLQQQFSKVDVSNNQGGSKVDLPKPKRKPEKIPEFIRINIELEDRKSKDIPKASLIFAQRRAKSVFRLNKRRYEYSRQAERRASKQKSPQKEIFSTIQPQITEIKLLDKGQRRLKRTNNCCQLLKPQRSQSRKHKRKLLTEKIFREAEVCGWNNQENEDFNNYF